MAAWLDCLSEAEKVEWTRACMRDRGYILGGEQSHYCNEWDGLTVDETCREFRNCPHTNNGKEVG